MIRLRIQGSVDARDSLVGVLKNYDKYGINLAKRINNRKLSNLTYITMKPIEWIFLIILYSFYIKPEEIINNQYKYVT